MLLFVDDVVGKPYNLNFVQMVKGKWGKNQEDNVDTPSSSLACTWEVTCLRLLPGILLLLFTARCRRISEDGPSFRCHSGHELPPGPFRGRTEATPIVERRSPFRSVHCPRQGSLLMMAPKCCSATGHPNVIINEIRNVIRFQAAKSRLIS